MNKRKCDQNEVKIAREHQKTHLIDDRAICRPPGEQFDLLIERLPRVAHQGRGGRESLYLPGGSPALPG